MMIDGLVDGHFNRDGLGYGDLDVLLDWHWYWFFHVVVHLFLHLERYRFLDGDSDGLDHRNGNGLWHVHVDGVGLWHRDRYRLGDWYWNRMGDGYADVLVNWNGYRFVDFHGV
jgi:hypothetical protein